MCQGHIAKKAFFSSFRLITLFVNQNHFPIVDARAILHKMSVKRNLNYRMVPTKLPVTTAVIIETCEKPSNTTSYMFFLHFLQVIK